MYVPVSLRRVKKHPERATREQLYGMNTSLPTLQLPERHLQFAVHYEQAKGDSFYGDQAALLLHWRKMKFPDKICKRFWNPQGVACTQARIGIIVHSFSTPNGGDDDDDDDALVSIFYVFIVCRLLQRKVVISFAKRMSSYCQLQILADKLNQSSGKYFNIKAFFLLLSHRSEYRIRNCSFWQRRSPWFRIYFRRTELRVFSLGATRHL